MVIRNGKKTYKLSHDNSDIEKWEQFSFGLSTYSNPNIIIDDKGEIIQVMIQLSRSTYECLQNQGFSNATESSCSTVIVNVSPSLMENLTRDPKWFWEHYIDGGKS
jgi:hypothetical protein